MADWGFIAGNPLVDRYVSSLYEVSIKKEIEEKVSRQLTEIQLCVLNISNYQKFLRRISRIYADGIAFVENLKLNLNLLDEVYNFLKLLLENNRIELICDMCDHFSVMMAEEKKTFYITYAKNFTENDEKNTMSNLEKIFGNNLECIIKHDPELIDGIKIQYRYKILDYSVKSKLERLHCAIRGDNQ